MMAKTMKLLTLAFVILFSLFLVFYISYSHSVFLSLCITFGTILYHLAMRLAVGGLINSIFHNKIDYNSRWFKERKFERKLYRRLKINKLKKIPTYSPETFSISLHTFEEIVHEIIFVLSYIPLLFTLLFDDFWVFLLTSFFASLIDLFFVVVQRYKRPILVRYIKRHRSNAVKWT